MNKKKINVKKLIIFLVIIAVVVAVIVYFRKGTSTVSAEATMVESQVSRGDIEVKLSGSGTVEPYERYEITSLVQGEILTSPYEEGDSVQKDAILYTIDSDNAQSNITKSQNSIEKAIISNNDTEENIKNLTIKATQSGYITDFNLEVGDSVNNNAKIATITNSDELTLKVAFNQTQISSLYVGQPVNIVMADYMSYVYGTISYINSVSRVASDGSVVYDVEVKATNPGAVVNGTKASVTVSTSNGTEKSVVDGNIEIKSVSVNSKVSGDVSAVYVKNNEKVYEGQVIAVLTNDNYYNSRKQNALNMSDLQENLQNAYDTLDDYTITSPIDGVVITKNKKAGDKIGNSSSSSSSSNTSTLMVVADISKMKFTMNIDELDITNIAIGQEVQITADALENQSFVGRISNIPAEGVTQSGVTNYSVEVVIDEPGELKTGMNVDAEIVIEKVENVLRIPVSATTSVRGKYYAYVKDDGTSVSVSDASDSSESSDNNDNVKPVNKNIPDGYMLKEIETGINNGDYIEVKSGLNEGDTVYSLITSKSDDSSLMQMNMMGGSMSGMTGGGEMQGGGGQGRSNGGGGGEGRPGGAPN